MSAKKVTVEISPSTIVSAIGIFLFTYFLFLIRNVLAMILISFIISSAFSPIINLLTKRKVPKGLAITVVYLLSLIIVITLISIISVPLAKEILRLLNNLPNTIIGVADQLSSLGVDSDLLGIELLSSNIENWASALSQNLGNIISVGASGISGATRILSGLFGGLLTFISIIAISIYMSLDKDHFYDEILLKVTDKSISKRLRKFILEVESKLGSWLIGQTGLSITVGLLALTVYSIVNLPYAGSIALLTSLLNIIPNLGPIIIFIPAFLLALSTGNAFTIIGTVIGGIAIQQFEGNILAPKILSGAVGLPPLLILLSIIIGAQLLGIAGILLAVPVSVIIHLLLNFLSES